MEYNYQSPEKYRIFTSLIIQYPPGDNCKKHYEEQENS